jgi:UDP-glucuronate decarboxylase
MRDLAALIIELTGSKSRIVFRPLPQDDPCRRRPEISRAKEQLGWTPTVGLKEGLLDTIKYFEELLSQPEFRSLIGARYAQMPIR